MGHRFSAGNIQPSVAAVFFQQFTILLKYFFCVCQTFKRTVILLIAMLTTKVAAVCNMPLECKFFIAESFHRQNEELPPLPQPPELQLEQLEPLEQLEQLEPLEQLEQLLPESLLEEAGGR